MLGSACFEKTRKPARIYSDNEMVRRERNMEAKRRGKAESKLRREVQRWETWTSTEIF